MTVLFIKHMLVTGLMVQQVNTIRKNTLQLSDRATHCAPSQLTKLPSQRVFPGLKFNLRNGVFLKNKITNS